MLKLPFKKYKKKHVLLQEPIEPMKLLQQMLKQEQDGNWMQLLQHKKKPNDKKQQRNSLLFKRNQNKMFLKKEVGMYLRIIFYRKNHHEKLQKIQVIVQVIV